MNIKNKLLNIKRTINSMLLESVEDRNPSQGLLDFAKSVKPDQTSWGRIREIILEKLVMALKRIKESIGFAHMESEGETWKTKLYNLGKKVLTTITNYNPFQRLKNVTNSSAPSIMVAAILGLIIYICGAVYFYVGDKGENLIQVIISSIKSGFTEVGTLIKKFIEDSKLMKTPEDYAMGVINLIKTVILVPAKFIKGTLSGLEEKKVFSFMGEYEFGFLIFGQLLIYAAIVMNTSNGVSNA